MVGHILRFHPSFEKLLDMVKGGELGDIRYVHSHRVGFGKFHDKFDALWDLAPHDLSMILAITGEEPSAVRGEGTAIIDKISDFAHVHLEFPSGIRGHLFASRMNSYRERFLTMLSLGIGSLHSTSTKYGARMISGLSNRSIRSISPSRKECR
jgi:predicted dehydrogenase